MNSFFLSGSLPPTSEGSAEPCEAIGASLRTQVRIFKSCNLCPDSSLYPVLFYFSIPDRFLRPFKNDRQVFNTVEKRNSPEPSFLSGGQNRNDDKRKNIM